MYHINKEITGSGENIALKNTARHYFKSFDILGNSVQEGTPSIDSEAPIESVGDNINLFDGIFNKHDIANDTGIEQSFESANHLLTANYIEVKSNTDYTLSFDHIFSANTGITKIMEFDKDHNFITRNSASSKTNIITFKTSGNCHYIRVGIFDAGGISETKLKIEKGTKATPNSPYGQGSVEIYNCNKNLFDKNDTNKILSAIPDGNTLKINSSSTARIFYIKCKPNTNYTISKLASKRLQMWDSIEKPAIGVTVNSVLNTDYAFSGTKKTVKTSSSAKYLVCYYYNSSTDTLSEETIRNSIQLEEGETATEYVEGKSQTKALYAQQPFRAIGDVKDRFVKVDGVWYEEHNIDEYIFTGTENTFSNATVKTNVVKIPFYGLQNKIFKYSNSSVSHLLSNWFKCFQSASTQWNDTTNQDITINDAGNVTFSVSTSIATTTEEFKNKLVEQYSNGTPLKICYPLLTPTLIPCTPEQVEQLEYFEKEAYSYDEVTHIYSTDEVSPYFEVTAYQRISEEFKTRLKEGKITRGYLKVLATDTLPEIIIDENNYLKDLKIEELRYVPEEGIIGGTVAKRVSGNFNNVDSSFDIQDREIEVYLGVELEDETTEYIKYGTYIVQRPEDDQVNDNTSFEALDYMIKFNQEYKDRITYPCTLKQLLDDIVDQAGVNSKVATFANSDFIVENNQFEQGSTLRDVLKAITQVAFNWSRIDADDNLVMDFETREETDEELGIDDYFSFKKSDDYGPVNVIVLRNSQVEGENVTVKDEELINLPTNKNICPNDWIYGQYAPLDGSIGIYENRIRQKKLLKVKPNTEYYLNTFNDDYEIIIRTFLKDKTFSRNIGTLTPFMTNSEEYYIGVTIYSPSDNISALLELVNDNTIKPFICLNSEEDKTYIPFKAIGEIEYVIADNPFAYTELKRKELIEAGRRLFGLRYTPMTVDMLGLMYLNAKDRITVENLNGQKYSTYLFDHTIDYTGIVLDSMESKAKSKTETKYQYVSSLAQGLSHVEIKVDKANKRIESIIESQEDVSKKVAKTVARIEVVYASSDSPTEAPTDEWSTTAPEWVEGKYMWQKTITTYANGTTAETAATNISGAKGEAGKNGIGITQTNITYQKSTSGTTVPTGTWQTTIPEVDEDGYLWTRTEFIYSDGSKKYAYNVGKKGATGIGVKSIIDQYYSSTSNTEVTGGEWKETQDTLQTDRFIWTRSKITWTNESVTYTDPILANTLNDINSNIIVFKDFKASQESTNQSIKSSIQETTKKLNDEYLTADKVNEKIDKIDDDYTILESRVAQTELDSKSFKVSIETIQNTGVDKIKTSMGYTFNDNGLNIDRTGSDTSTVIDEAKIKVTDKTGGQPKSLLYAGYVKEGDTEFSDYEGQTIVATSNLIVQNFLIIGSNSRFQDYYNETLGGNGTGAFDI